MKRSRIASIIAIAALAASQQSFGENTANKETPPPAAESAAKSGDKEQIVILGKRILCNSLANLLTSKTSDYPDPEKEPLKVKMIMIGCLKDIPLDETPQDVKKEVEGLLEIGKATEAFLNEPGEMSEEDRKAKEAEYLAQIAQGEEKLEKACKEHGVDLAEIPAAYGDRALQFLITTVEKEGKPDGKEKTEEIKTRLYEYVLSLQPDAAQEHDNAPESKKESTPDQHPS